MEQLTKTQLIKSGWRKSQIGRWLKQPDEEIDRDGSIVKLYHPGRVAAAMKLRQRARTVRRKARQRLGCRIKEGKHPAKSKELQCRDCGDKGHMANECPNKNEFARNTNFPTWHIVKTLAEIKTELGVVDETADQRLIAAHNAIKKKTRPADSGKECR